MIITDMGAARSLGAVRSVRRQAQVFEDATDDVGLSYQGDDLASAATVGTAEDVLSEHPLHELCPREFRTACSRRAPRAAGPCGGRAGDDVIGPAIGGRSGNRDGSVPALVRRILGIRTARRVVVD